MTCKDIIRGTDRGPSVPTSCLRSTANSTTSLPSYRAPALATSIGFRLFTAQTRHFDGHLRFTFFLKVPRQHYHQLLSPSQPSASGGLASPGTLSSLTLIVGFWRTRLPRHAQLIDINVGFWRTRLPRHAQLIVINVGFWRTRLPRHARPTTTSLIFYSDFGSCRMLSPIPAVRTIAYLIGTPTPQRLLSARQPLAALLSIRASFICLEYSRIEPRGGS